MTTRQPQWGIEITAWRLNKKTVVLDWRTMETGWVAVPPARGQHIRVLLDYEGDLTNAALTVLTSRMAAYVVGKKHWVVNLPKGIPFREVGAEGVAAPPSGGPQGESPDPVMPGQETLPGLDNRGTIITPPTGAKLEAASEAKPRSPRSKSPSKTDAKNS